MGFGTLFAFYIVSFILSFNPYGSIFRLLGYLGMVMGLCNLQQYQKTFLFPIYVSPVMIVTAAYQVCTTLETSFGIYVPFVSDTLTAVFDYIGAGAILLFHAALLYAVWCIAREIGLPKIMQNAARNAVVMALYYVLYLIAFLPFAWVETYRQYAAVVVILLPLVWGILNAMLIYSCYHYICQEGEEDVPLRVSRFAFVNKIRQEMERKEQQGIEATIEHAKKNQREHMEGKARNRELRIQYAERRDKMQKHKNEKKKKR